MTTTPSRTDVFLAAMKELLGNRPGTLTDLYEAEQNVRQVYSDRFVFELLQNARDAAALAPGCGGRVLFLLLDDALLVANDGAPFTREGVEAVKGFGKSPKKGPTPSGGGKRPTLIGRKGIGFKSVLQVSQQPAIFGRTAADGRLAIEFGGSRIQGLCRCVAEGDVSGLERLLSVDELQLLKAHLDGQPLWRHSLPAGMREPFAISLEALLSQLPVMRLPLWKAELPPRVEGLLGWAPGELVPYQTVIHLPLDSGRLASVRARLKEDVVPEKLLFLGTLRRVEVQDVAQGDGWFVAADWSSDGNGVSLRHARAREAEITTTYAVYSKSVAVKATREEREERDIKVAIPVLEGRLRPFQERKHLYTYYPLADEGRLFPFLVHAEFEPDPGRTKLSADHQHLNDQLLEAAADLIAGAPGTASVLQAITDGTVDARRHMPGLLIPAQGDRVASQRLREGILRRLRGERCVPTSEGWSQPSAVMSPGEYQPLLLPLEAEFATLGQRLPSADWDPDAGTIEGLGSPRYGPAHVSALLASGCTRAWSGQDAVGRFRQLFALIDRTVAAVPERQSLLDPFRPNGAHSGIPLLPCRQPSGVVTVLPLPARRKAGGLTSEERRSTRIFRPPADLTEDVPVPPDDLQIRFLDERLHLPGGEGPPLEPNFADTVLDVRAFDTTAVIQAIADFETTEAPAEAKVQLARFTLAFLVTLPPENPDRIAFLARARERETPQPDKHAPPYTTSEWTSRLRAFSNVHLPDRTGAVLPPDALRFTGFWSPAHENLDLLDPPETSSLADPQSLVEFLGAESCARHIDSAGRLLLAGDSEAGDATVAKALAWGFARVAGVWETAPVDRFEGPVAALASVGTTGEPYRKWLDAHYLRFDQAGPHHRAATIRTSRVRGHGAIAKSPARRAALGALLNRDWMAYFRGLRISQLECAGCRGANQTGNHSTYRQGSAPSLLYWELSTSTWYAIRAEDEPYAPGTLWLVREEDWSDQGAFSLVTCIPAESDTERTLLMELGAAEFETATPTQLAKLLADLARRAVPAGQELRLLISLHQRIYRKLANHHREKRIDPASLAKLQQLKYLCQRNGQYLFAPPVELLIDDGRHTQARSLFRRELAFLALDDVETALFEQLGVRRFEATLEVETGAKREVGAQFREALEPWWPALFALSWNSPPGGGVSPGRDGETATRRLQRYQEVGVYACEELAVRWTANGRPDLPARVAQAKGTSRAYLLERKDETFANRSSSTLELLLPERWWKGNQVEEEGRSQLAGPLAALMATSRHEDAFALLLALDPDEIDTFLDERGISEEDVVEARKALALRGSGAAQRTYLAWRALLQCWPDAAERAALESKPSLDSWDKVSRLEGSSALVDMAVRAAPLLILPETLRQGGAASPLGSLQASGFDMAKVSRELEAARLGAIHLRELPDLLGRWRLLWSGHVSAVLNVLGMSPERARRASDEAFATPASLRFDARATAASLAKTVKVALEGLGLRDLPSLDSPVTVMRAALARAAGISEQQLEEVNERLRDPEEHARKVAEQFRRQLDSWHPVLVTLAIPVEQLKAAVIRAVSMECRATIGQAFQQEADANSPFIAWLMLRCGIKLDVAGTLVESLSRGVPTAELGALAGRPGLAADVERVKRLLDDASSRRRAQLRSQFERFASIPPPSTLGPAAGVGAVPPASQGIRGHSIGAGHAGDPKSKRAKERLGKDGEAIALAWVLRELGDRAAAGSDALSATIKSMRAKLGEFLLEPEVMARVDEAAQALLQTSLEDDEFLEAAAQFCHLSSLSDGFGCDLLALGASGAPLLVEVKTSRSNQDPFHLSRWQRQVAEALGASYAILRVIVPEGGSPTLMLLPDPVELERAGRLVVDPESFEVTVLG